MNKTEFIAAVAEKAGLTKADAKKAVDASLEVIEASLKKGEKVSFLGFGSFEVIERAARMGVNPRTKEKIKIKSRKVAKFKPGANLDLTKKRK
ncbi:MAG: HU family DNA-binding protein [Porphyromonas sp.]|nr:HU family DNA-binding protein [Porphyromonas sp.]